MRWKLVSGVLIALAVAALVVSLVSFHNGSDGLFAAARQVDEHRDGIRVVRQVAHGVWDAGLWRGIAIGLGAAGVAVLGTGLVRSRRPGVRRWLVLAATLGVLAAGALVASLALHYHPVTRYGFTVYWPIDVERSGANQITVTFRDPDTGSLRDERLWLGLAIGLGAAGIVVLTAALRARRS